MLVALKKLADLGAAGFKPIGAGETSHLAAIGRLIVSFSTNIHLRISALLQIQLQLYDDAAKRAVVGEMSLGATMAAVLRIAEARSLDPKTLDSMKRLWTEIHRLHGVRGKIAHRTCMIAGDKLAFHNALLAKSEADIEIEIYSTKELNELSDYAERLGCRLLLLMAPLVKKRQPNTEIALGHLSYTMLLGATRQLIEENKIRGKTASEAGEKMKRAHSALKAYSDTMQEIGSKLADQEYEANTTMYALAESLSQIGATGGEALYEIPDRLQPKDHSRRKD